jgi:hypothetical protein
MKIPQLAAVVSCEGPHPNQADQYLNRPENLIFKDRTSKKKTLAKFHDCSVTDVRIPNGKMGCTGASREREQIARDPILYSILAASVVFPSSYTII